MTSFEEPNQAGVRLSVLLYHHIGPLCTVTGPGLTIPAEAFEKQVSWLVQRGYFGIRPSDLLVWHNTGRGLPSKSVLITFDDAYADIADFALPALHRLGFGAAVFVVTGLVGQANAWDKVHGARRHPLMSAKQIREWSTKGIEFGAHGRTHASLVGLPQQRLAEEIDGSREDLAQILGFRPIAFAYPYGAHDSAIRKRVQSAFAMAFTCDEGLNDLRTDPYRLRRTMVLPSDSLIDLGCRVRWGWSPIEHLRARLRLRTRLRRVFAALRNRDE